MAQRTFTGLDLFLNYIDRIASDAAMLNALDDLGRAAVLASKRYINAGKVKPVSLAAKERVRIKGGVPKTLLDTGRGRSSIDHRVNRVDESVAIGTNVEYMKDHREGRNGQIQREFLVEPSLKDIERIIAFWLEGRR